LARQEWKAESGKRKKSLAYLLRRGKSGKNDANRDNDFIELLLIKINWRYGIHFMRYRLIPCLWIIHCSLILTAVRPLIGQHYLALKIKCKGKLKILLILLGVGRVPTLWSTSPRHSPRRRGRIFSASLEKLVKISK
jgi:hypothetical protein